MLFFFNCYTQKWVNQSEKAVNWYNDILQWDKELSTGLLNIKTIILKCLWIAYFGSTGPWYKSQTGDLTSSL